MASFTHVLAFACMFTVTWATTYDIPFTSCEGITAPSAVRMQCSSFLRGTCLLNKGQTYSMQAEFTPQTSVEEIESSVAWKAWVEMPLTDQDFDACNSQITCPLTQGSPTTFSYSLHIPNYWMRRRYPIVWRLTDDDTNTRILCFTVRVQITS
ncbi:NPC intracellular cholesterol transporter 2-like [Homarus americanus]|uniref:NPC intracellular cholesterol transporter 2-like n=1 Tax=Homarus americanus TaxID=6706 RepID=UPI001C4427DA|nr:NPC intracellular cholesterol transporter 2-like [Homarus americanus]